MFLFYRFVICLGKIYFLYITMLLGLNLDGVKIHMLVRKTLGKQIAQEKYRGGGWNQPRLNTLKY